jgi:hypothetical protein
MVDDDTVVVRQLDLERCWYASHGRDALVFADQSQADRVGVLLARHELDPVPFEEVALVAVVRHPPVLTVLVLDEAHRFDGNLAALFGEALAHRGRVTLSFAALLGRLARLRAGEVEDVDHVVTGE